MANADARRPLGRSKRRWEYNIKTDVTNNRCRTGSVWLRTENNGDILWTLTWTLRFRKTRRNFLTSCGNVSFSRRSLLVHCDQIASRQHILHLQIIIWSFSLPNVSRIKLWTKRIPLCAFWRTAVRDRFCNYRWNSILYRTRQTGIYASQNWMYTSQIKCQCVSVETHFVSLPEHTNCNSARFVHTNHLVNQRKEGTFKEWSLVLSVSWEREIGAIMSLGWGGKQCFVEYKNN
jgi:hypothetical protein